VYGFHLGKLWEEEVVNGTEELVAGIGEDVFDEKLSGKWTGFVMISG
jgi:hypothetical protein